MTPKVVFDLDLENCFCTLEWPQIREAMRELMPELQAWEEWCQASETEVVLPCGLSSFTNRGAEQGDPLGSAKTAITLAVACSKAFETLREQLPDGASPGVQSWFIDDGQLIVEPRLADTVLRAIDEQLAAIGASRGRGRDVKSVARLLSSLGAVVPAN